jgi:phosphoglycerol transferase
MRFGILSALLSYIKKTIRAYSLYDLALMLLFAFSATFFIRRTYDLMMRRYWIIAVLIFIALIFLRVADRQRMPKKSKLLLFTSVPVLLVIIHTWFIDIFGSFDIGAILFHLGMDVESGSVADIIVETLGYVAVATMLLVSFHYIARRDVRLYYADRLLALPLFLLTPVTAEFGSYYLHKNDGDKLLPYYQAVPADLKLHADQARKNIIMIYAESAEETFGKLSDGDDIFKDMKDISGRGLYFNNIAQAANTGWTIAGIVSSQCGVPLQPNGLFARNKFETQTNFMPSAVCLGDVLSNNGYNIAFLSGASTKFAGTDIFLKDHGYNIIDGGENYPDQFTDYKNFWGLYDDTVFDLAEKQITSLQEQGKPYFFAMKTLAGHFPIGFPTRRCINNIGPVEGESIRYSIKCTGYEIKSFLSKLQAGGQLENTLVVVMSDHLSMKSSAWSELNQHERRNYFTVIGTDRGQEIITKQAAMFDAYPTILELLGFTLNNHQAGIGISMLSDRKGLIEELGPVKLDQLISHDRDLAQFLWAAPAVTLTSH